MSNIPTEIKDNTVIANGMIGNFSDKYRAFIVSLIQRFWQQTLGLSDLHLLFD